MSQLVRYRGIRNEKASEEEGPQSGLGKACGDEGLERSLGTLWLLTWALRKASLRLEKRPPSSPLLRTIFRPFSRQLSVGFSSLSRLLLDLWLLCLWSFFSWSFSLLLLDL